MAAPKNKPTQVTPEQLSGQEGCLSSQPDASTGDFGPEYERGAQARALLELGRRLFFRADYAGALQTYSQALNTFASAEIADTIAAADCYQAIATCAAMGASPDRAQIIACAGRAYQIYSLHMPPDDLRLDLSVQVLAQYAASPAEAISFRQQRVQIFQKNYQDYPMLIGAEMYVLAVTLADNNQLNHAITVARQARELCLRAGSESAYIRFIEDNIALWYLQLDFSG